MKTRYGKIFAILGALCLCLLLLPQSASAQSGTELSDYVDMDHLDRYLKAEFYGTQYVSLRTEIALSEFKIPAYLEDELLMHIRFTLPEIVLGNGYHLTSSSEYVIGLTFFKGSHIEEIRAVGDMLVRGVEGNDALTDIEKALILHDRLALWVEYDFEAAEQEGTTPAHTVYGSLTNRMAVCEGYAGTYQYLLARAGIWSDVHTSAILDHAWNAVWLDGVSYMVDVTWDDNGGYYQQGLSHKPVSHDNFLSDDNRNLLVDNYVVEPYGTKYDSIWWPDTSFLVGDQVYCLVNGDFHYLEGLETYEVVIPGVDRIYVGEPAFGVGDKLLWPGSGFVSILDLTTGEEEYAGNLSGTAQTIEYNDGRIACLVNGQWEYPFADTAYTVTFQDWDGKTLQSATYEYGQIVYAPADPARSGYRFTGWDRRIDVCTGDTVYTARYESYQPDGWMKEDGEWYYLTEGRKKTGWYQEKGKWYYMNYAGIMETGLIGISRLEASIVQETKYYYLDSNGVMQTGWRKPNDSWYYFGSSGAALEGWQQIGGKWYFFMLGGEMETGTFLWNGKTYYLDENVGMVIGWRYTGSQWLYYGANGALTGEGWKQIGGKWYYFDAYGVMQTGWLKDNGVQYYLRSSGEMATGWERINNQWYYFTDGGRITTGWKQINGLWYYFGTEYHNEGQMTENMVMQFGDKWYYFNASGAMHTGWRKVNESWQYYDKNGVRVSGWQYIGGCWYYFCNTGWSYDVTATGFRTVDGTTYYFGKDGVMQTGWIRIVGAVNNSDGTKSDAWCYANSSGAIRFGWQEIGGNWYYFGGSVGYMYTGRMKIDGKWYTFSEDGVCQNP